MDCVKFLCSLKKKKMLQPRLLFSRWPLDGGVQHRDWPEPVETQQKGRWGGGESLFIINALRMNLPFWLSESLVIR